MSIDPGFGSCLIAACTLGPQSCHPFALEDAGACGSFPVPEHFTTTTTSWLLCGFSSCVPRLSHVGTVFGSVGTPCDWLGVGLAPPPPGWALMAWTKQCLTPLHQSQRQTLPEPEPGICQRKPAGVFPGGPVIETLPSKAAGVFWIPSWEAKIPQASLPPSPKKTTQNMKKQKHYCNFQ